MSDVWFAKEKPAAAAPQLGDLLVAPQGELLASGAAPAVQTGSVHAAFSLRGLLDDDNRQTPLL
jgi:hypothetical protein